MAWWVLTARLAARLGFVQQRFHFYYSTLVIRRMCYVVSQVIQFVISEWSVANVSKSLVFS